MILRARIEILLFILLSLMVSCKTQNVIPQAPDVEQIKKEIQAKENEFAEVYNSGELRNIGYYADDATSFFQNNPPAVGKPAIIAYLKAHLDSISTGHKIAFTTNEVFVSSDGNMVLETGFFRVSDADSIIVNSGSYMSLFIKRDGKYVCVRDMSTSNIPVE